MKFATWKFLTLLITNEFMTQKFKTTDPIDWMKFINTQRFSQSPIVKLDM